MMNQGEPFHVTLLLTSAVYIYIYICTEVPELQDEERPKSLAPPPTAQTAGPNWLKF